MFKEVNSITMNAINIPMSKIFDSSCHMLYKIIYLGNDLDLYIQERSRSFS